MNKMVVGVVMLVISVSAWAAASIPQVFCKLEWGQPTQYFAGTFGPAIVGNTIWLPGPQLNPGVGSGEASNWNVAVQGVVGYHMSPVVPQCTVLNIDRTQTVDGQWRGINLVLISSDASMEDRQLAVRIWDAVEERIVHIKFQRRKGLPPAVSTLLLD